MEAIATGRVTKRKIKSSNQGSWINLLKEELAFAWTGLPILPTKSSMKRRSLLSIMPILGCVSLYGRGGQKLSVSIMENKPAVNLQERWLTWRA